MASEKLQVILQMVAGQYKSEARQAASATGQIGRSAQMTGTQTRTMGQKMKGLATGGGGLVAMAGGAFAAKKAFDGTIGAFANFDDAMTESLAIMGDVSSEMRNEMSDAAREVAKTTTFSAEEAAEAYFFLASAGLDATQSVEAMPQVARFAQAGMFDLATATDLATDAQSVLGLTSEDAGENLKNLTRVTDVLVNANTQANATVEQFATSLTQKAGGALRSVEKDLEEGIAVLSVFADQGIKGERGGTILRATLDGLSNNARDNADAFKEFGVSVFDSEENMRNMADITVDLEEALGPMTVETREAALAQLGFNKRSREGILALIGNSEALREYEDSARSAGDATKEVADKQLESAKKQWELFLSGLQDVGIELGEEVLPALMDMLPALQDTTEGVGDFVEAAGPLIDVLGLIAQGYTDIRDSSEGMVERGKETGNVFEFIGGVITKMSTQGAFANFAFVLDEIQTAFGDSGDAAEEATPGFSTLGGEMNQIPEAAREAADGMTDAERAARNAFGPVSNLAGAAADQGGAWDDVVDSMEDYEDMLRRLTDPVFAAIDDQRNLEEATQNYLDVIDDPESTIGEQERAMLDLIRAQREAESSAAELPDDLQAAADHIAILGDRAGITDEHLQILRDTIMEFDGLSAQSTIGINVVGGEQITGLDINRNIVLRQHGGPVRANQPAIVGEDGPELFIPQQSGQVISNQQMTATTGNMGGGQTINVFTLTWSDFVRKSADAGLEIQRYGW